MPYAYAVLYLVSHCFIMELSIANLICCLMMVDYCLNKDFIHRNFDAQFIHDSECFSAIN